MNRKKALYAATFSFLLPGLGQVFTGRLVPGVGCFMVFATLMALPEIRAWVPLLAIVAALEAFWGVKRGGIEERSTWVQGEIAFWKSQKNSYHLPAYLFASVMGGLSWLFLVLPMGSPMVVQAEINDRVDYLARYVYQFTADHRALPKGFEDCIQKLGLDRSKTLDPWKNTYQLEQMDRGFKIRSFGPDRSQDTSDDLVYTFPL